MKRGVLLFIFFLVPVGLIAQTYTLQIGGEPYNPNQEQQPIGGFIIEVVGSSGQTYTLKDLDEENSYWYMDGTFEIPFRPTTIQVRQKSTNNICYSYNIKTCINNGTWPEALIAFCGTTYKWNARMLTVYPNLTTQNVTSEPSPICGKYTFQASPNWSPWHYQWEYKIGTGNWTSFSGSGNWTSKLEFGKNDVPGLGFNEAIQVRLNKCSYFGIDKGTSIYTVSFISCSPHLDSFNTVDTQCSYSSDGGFTAFFDRALNSGERMIMRLFEKDALGNELFIGEEATYTLETNNGYTWPFPLPSGDYLVKYQADNNGTFSSLEPSIPFTIDSPDAISFSAVKGKGVSCFGGSDGTIQVEAYNSTGFQLKVMKDGTVIRDWMDFSGPNTHTLSGLSYGNYEVFVRDGKGCFEPLGDGTEKTIPVYIDQPAGILALNLVNSFNLDANGFTDGSVMVSISGGTRYGDGSYQLVWKNSAGTVLNSVSNEVVASGYRTTLNSVGAGNYTLTVTDSKGCTTTATYTITEPPALSLEVQETNSISCNSSNTYGDPSSDGELMVVASGGVPFDPPLPGGNLYKYSWKKKDISGNWQLLTGVTGPIVTGLSAGDYAVNIEDAKGIVIGNYQNNSLVTATDVEYALSEPPLLNITLTKQDVLCPGGWDGSVTAAITGGTGTYSVFWNTGETTRKISDLSGGTYTIQVIDEKGCLAESSITITEPQTPLQITYEASEPTYSGATDGWIKAKVTGGTPYGDDSYNYQWKDAGSINLSGQVTARVIAGGYELLLNNIGAGSYHLTVKDRNYSLTTDIPNCTIVESEYLLEEPQPLSLTLVEQNPISCNSSNNYGDPSADGTLKAVASGGVPFDPPLPDGNLYKYTWKKKDPSGNWQLINGITDPVASGLTAGDYAVNIEDANGIVFGTYQNNTLVQATDEEFTLVEPPLLNIELTKQDVLCPDSMEGSVTANITGGAGPYSIFWNTGATTPEIRNLSGGTYSIRVTDERGCQAESSILVNEPQQSLQVSFTESKPSFSGAKDGWIKAIVTGGTPYGDDSYNYQWEDAGSINLSGQVTARVIAGGYELLLDNVGAGNYYLTVEDRNYSLATDNTNCTTVRNEYLLKEPEPLSLTLVEQNPISCNTSNDYGDPSADGALKAMVSGGVPFDPPLPDGSQYKYTWKKKDAFGNWQMITGITGPVASGLSAGDYAVNIEDANGTVFGTYQNNTLIQATDAEYTLVEPPLLNVELTSQDVFCPGGGDGSVTAAITGGTGAYSISWNTGDTTPGINNLSGGTYTIQVTDERGCRAESSIVVNEPQQALQVSYTESKPSFSGATDGWIKAIVTGGTPFGDDSYNYNWEDAGANSMAGQVTAQVISGGYELLLSDIGAGSYYLTVEDMNYSLATNKTKCTIAQSEYTLVDPAPLSLMVVEQKSISCNGSNTYGDPSADGVLEAVAAGGVILGAGENGGLPYYYTWKKFVNANWEVLPNQTTNIASNLDAGLYAVNIEDANGIVIGTYQNNVLVQTKDVEYTLKDPPLLELGINSQDVYCFEGSDGWAEALVTGGIPPYNYLWSNNITDSKISQLTEGTYGVTVTDSRGCQVSGSVNITSPAEPIQVTYSAFSRPTSIGFSDAWIRAEITGGTALQDGTYNFTWKDDAGSDLVGQVTASVTTGGTYQIQLDDIPAGSYYLAIEDANYNASSTKDGCTLLESTFELVEPIEAAIEEVLQISCNSANTFENPFSDGVLIASVQGGVPFETGQAYIYHWKKRDLAGNWVELPQQTSEVAMDLSVGDYALNVEDSMGNVIGIYQSNNLLQATDVVYSLSEPELLTLSLSGTPISCGAGDDGTATVQISGGSGNYSIEWSNGATTETITNLIAGTYLVHVMDEQGCEATGQVAMEQPGGIDVAVTAQKAPSCYQGTDGAITINVTGGSSPYNYEWNNGATGTALQSLSKGTYQVRVTDANGCVAFKEVTLEDPEQIILELGEDRTLCNGQEYYHDIRINDTGATYLWQSDNGFSSTSPVVSLTEAGTYTATVTNGAGCVSSDSITIATSTTDIDSEFVVSTQGFVGEEIIIVNTSDPISAQAEWILPGEAQVIQQSPENVTIRFSQVGVYQVTLRSFQGECYQDFSKPVVVEYARDLPDVGDTETPFLEEFVVYPNPNDGQFQVSVSLAEPASVSLRLFSQISSTPLDDRLLHGSDHYNTDYQVSLPSGVYTLLLETSKIRDIRRIVIE